MLLDHPFQSHYVEFGDNVKQDYEQCGYLNAGERCGRPPSEHHSHIDDYVLGIKKSNPISMLINFEPDPPDPLLQVQIGSLIAVEGKTRDGRTVKLKTIVTEKVIE